MLVNHSSRGIRQMGPFAVDAITSFSYFPLQLATYIGFFDGSFECYRHFDCHLFAPFHSFNTAFRSGNHIGGRAIFGWRAVN